MKESIFPGNLREKVTDSILSNSPDRVYFPPLWFSLGKSICCDSRHIFTAVPLYPGGNSTCGGRPLTSPDPVPPPLLGLEPVSRLSSARLTRRNTKALVTFPLPVL